MSASWMLQSMTDDSLMLSVRPAVSVVSTTANHTATKQCSIVHIIHDDTHTQHKTEIKTNSCADITEWI